MSLIATGPKNENFVSLRNDFIFLPPNKHFESEETFCIENYEYDDNSFEVTLIQKQNDVLNKLITRICFHFRLKNLIVPIDGAKNSRIYREYDYMDAAGVFIYSRYSKGFFIIYQTRCFSQCILFISHLHYDCVLWRAKTFEFTWENFSRLFIMFSRGAVNIGHHQIQC